MSTALPVPHSAAEIFGDRLDLAERYVEFLRTAGIDRGLIGPRESPRMWERHVLNCTAVGAAIPKEMLARPVSVTDIGSGAGLPGIPLVLAHPNLRMHLVEPLQRRCEFLAEAIEVLELADRGLEVTVHRGRAEDREIVRTVAAADILTARAVAPLAKLARWGTPLLREGGIFLALKGQTAAEELERDGKAMANCGLIDRSARTIEVPDADPTFVVMATKTTVTSGRRKSPRR